MLEYITKERCKVEGCANLSYPSPKTNVKSAPNSNPKNNTNPKPTPKGGGVVGYICKWMHIIM